MHLKAKLIKLSAGRPVAIINKNFAEKSSIHVDDRVYIEKSGKKIAAVVDTASGLVKENEIALSTEVASCMQIKQGSEVNVEIALKPESLHLIYKKLNCKRLSLSELKHIMSDIVNNKITESEIAFFVAAVYKCGMSNQETISLIKAILSTGKTLGLKGKVVDKHSVGGIPGRTTPIIVAICASTGLIIPKTSSRAITSPAGTADCMEVLCKVNFSLSEIKKIIKKTNACIVWGGALNLAPADDKIIQIERLLNLDPESQLLASILSKKIAVNSKYVLIDIPYGKNAKVDFKKAKDLAKKFKKIAKHFNIKLECSLKETPEPIGNGIGPALEIKDVLEVLRRENSCYKLESRSLELSGQLLELTGKADKGRGFSLAKSILDSGQAYQKFKEIILAQKGKLNGIKPARFNHDIKAEASGKIKEINTKLINELARVLGCPADKSSGIYLHKHLHDKVKKGEVLLTLYSESQDELKEGTKFYHKYQPILLS